MADNALVANWCACAAFLAKAVPSLRHIGGSTPSGGPPSPSSGLPWGGAVSAFDRVRKFLVDGEAVEARRHADADSRFKAAQARGSDTVPQRVRGVPHPGHERLEVAKRSLTFLDLDFSRSPNEATAGSAASPLQAGTRASARGALRTHPLAQRPRGPR